MVLASTTLVYVFAAEPLGIEVLKWSIVPPTKGRKILEEGYQKIRTSEIDQAQFFGGQKCITEEEKIRIKGTGQ